MRFGGSAVMKVRFSGFKAQCLWLRGLKRFHQGRCDEAVRLLRQAFVLDPTTYEVSSLHYALLGRSYLALGQLEDALTMLSHAYELFHQEDQSRWREFEREQFMATLKAFANTLHRCGQFARAQEVVQEVGAYAASSVSRD
jgi:tetratricopeptide (TPR) repeat protein